MKKKKKSQVNEVYRSVGYVCVCMCDSLPTGICGKEFDPKAFSHTLICYPHTRFFYPTIYLSDYIHSWPSQLNFAM